jgi:uncharacterized damage-inducible protein DinB
LSEVRPEPWLRGPIEGVDPLLLPAAHALQQSREDIASAAAGLTVSQLWRRLPGDAASVGFHLRHVAGSIDRLLTYAAGRQLDDEQMRTLGGESLAGEPPVTAVTLVREAQQAIDRAIEVIRSTPSARLTERRTVGRAMRPSTLGGLLFHIAEHTQRHAGQIVTSARVVAAS